MVRRAVSNIAGPRRVVHPGQGRGGAGRRPVHDLGGPPAVGGCAGDRKDHAGKVVGRVDRQPGGPYPVHPRPASVGLRGRADLRPVDRLFRFPGGSGLHPDPDRRRDQPGVAENTIDLSGTYRLPHAQVDRFTMKLQMGYPDHAAFIEILANRAAGFSPEQMTPVMTPTDVIEMMTIAAGVYLSPQVLEYIATICEWTRPDRQRAIQLGVSPRGGIALTVVARTHAAAHGQTFVTADNVKTVAPAVLAHRLILDPEAELQGVTAAQVIAS